MPPYRVPRGSGLPARTSQRIARQRGQRRARRPRRGCARRRVAGCPRACASTRPAAGPGRSRSRSGRPRGRRPRNGLWSSMTGAAVPSNGAGLPVCLSAASANEPVEAGVGVRLARDLEVAVADHVEQDHRPDLGQRRRALRAAPAGVATNWRLPRSPDRAKAAASLPGPRASSASKKTSVERRALEAPRQVARQLEQHRDARGAVVGADEAGDVLGVVVGADDDRRRARGPGCGRRRCARDAGPARRRTPASRSRRAISRTSRRLAAEPAGRGPIRTCARQVAKARWASNLPGWDERRLAAGTAAAAAEQEGGGHGAPAPTAAALSMTDRPSFPMARPWLAARVVAWPNSTWTGSARSTSRSSPTRAPRATCTSAGS